jgi:selenocysteine-specific elongation factor
LDPAALEERVIVGTAGHIDHGKSALVRALTGTTMDRLPEERRRGITIDLGFAPLDLDGVTAGVVDVPGHEDFIRTMVAGASGIDLALLVIAADEGIMPQTEEHLAILEQLAVPAVVPVITKIDLVDPDWLELVIGEVIERLAGSSLSFDPPAAVSAVAGTGLDALRRRLRDHASRVRARPTGDLFRLPLDRAFSVPGVGTVVTGTAWSGSVAIGDRVRLLPGGAEARVRSIECWGRGVERSLPGARTALGLAGLERAQARRGEVVVGGETPWGVSGRLDVAVTLLPGMRPLTMRTRVRLLLGTAEVMARVAPRAPVGDGSQMARLRLERPLAARGGDRFVLRSYSPVTTIGGGIVLDPDPPARPAAWSAELAAPDPAHRVSALVGRRPYGAPAVTLPLLTGLRPDVAERAANAVRDMQRVGDRWIRREVLTAARERVLSVLRGFHEREPGQEGMQLETLRRSLGAPEWLADAALQALAAAGRIQLRRTQARLAGFTPRVAGGEAELERVVAIVRQAGLAPPSVAELEQETGREDVASVLRLAAARGQVEPVERDRYYDGEALQRFADTLRELGQSGEIHPAAVRDRLGISRKFLIPLLEWADGQGITVRSGDGRRLASAHD